MCFVFTDFTQILQFSAVEIILAYLNFANYVPHHDNVSRNGWACILTHTNTLLIILELITILNNNMGKLSTHITDLKFTVPRVPIFTIWRFLATLETDLINKTS